ncbi:LytR/AlgR family response regulator transcription factor [Arundinibacter roseus]|uniref:Response regulator transcription factor n=1 Tax=Arundinibacter roseus TaxID=2070510 RepID=A0A4R4K5W6_9BACT|nr:LytTR family DNA-binding domain-containing protein [Arundinibacter roseus]TDB62800.1 response regulator transcription factor [Arundinibacter roseus]
MLPDLNDKRLSCLIVDDEAPAHQVIKSHIGKLNRFEIAAHCYTGLEAYQFLEKQPVDVLFLDIDMPELTGPELLRSLKIRPAVVFTTAYAEFGVESYELNVIDYLLKPIRFERFLQAAHKLATHFSHKPDPIVPTHISVKADGMTHRVLLSDIQYVEGLGNYLKIYIDTRPLIVLETMQNAEQRLSVGPFCRIHKSFIVNLGHISRILPGEILLNTGTRLPIGRRYAALLESRWLTFQAE